jgi:hypothetical protein
MQVSSVYIFLAFAVPGTRNGKKAYGSRGLYDNKEIRLRTKKKNFVKTLYTFLNESNLMRCAEISDLDYPTSVAIKIISANNCAINSNLIAT